MKTTIFISACLFLATLVAGPFLAQEVVIYPAKGQSQDQMEKDKYECYRWARDQTGFDPMQLPKATEPPPQQQARREGAATDAAIKAYITDVEKYETTPNQLVEDFEPLDQARSRVYRELVEVRQAMVERLSSKEWDKVFG